MFCMLTANRLMSSPKLETPDHGMVSLSFPLYVSSTMFSVLQEVKSIAYWRSLLTMMAAIDRHISKNDKKIKQTVIVLIQHTL